MPTTFWAFPELLSWPIFSSQRILLGHLCAATLATNFDLSFIHTINFTIGERRWHDILKMNKNVAGIVLAAGKSSRMGRPKALLPLGSEGQTFLTRIVGTFREVGVKEILVVTAVGSELTSALLNGNFPFRLILNESPELGQLSSFQVGLQSLDLSKVSGILMTPVDVPLVSVETVQSLIEAHSESLAPVVRPVRKKAHGHPVIFDRALFQEILFEPSDSTVKAIVHRHRDRSVEVAVNESGPFHDIDTPKDYEFLLRQFKLKKSEMAG